MNKCKYCGAPLDYDALFCANCGKKIGPQGKSCPQCGAETEIDSTFCAKCGTRLDTQPIIPDNPSQVVSAPPIQEEEEIVYEWEEEQKRKWWYIIGGVVFFIILFGGWYFYTYYHNSTNPVRIELTSDEESFFVERVQNWNDQNNNKGFDNSANCPYADTIYYYGMKMSGMEAAQKKQKALTAKTNYSQECANVKVTKITDKLVVCDFETHTLSKGKAKISRDCYLFFSNEGGETWKIKEEGDLDTDKNFLNKRLGSDDDVILPITLQYIRNYCNHLNLPYYFWDYVEKEIIEEELNVLQYYEPLWGNTYVLRGSIAMNYRYGNENPVYEKLNTVNYLEFCDAIGRIRDVWKVLPYKVENNIDENEQPLFQFKYEGDGLGNEIITAHYVQDGVEEMDDIPIYHYEYINDKNKEVKLDLLLE